MAEVYAWPPVAVVARYWTMEAPIGRSRSLITGASYVSASQRRRINAGFDVAGWPRHSAGYLEALWRLLDGGVNLVRLRSCRIPYGHTVDNSLRGERPLTWTTPPTEIGWEAGGSEMLWITGAALSYSLIAGQTAIRVSGLPPNARVALPGEFATIDNVDASEVIMITSEAVSNASGEAVVGLIRAPTAAGRVGLGGSETGIFELASDWPRVMNRNGFPENYQLQFRQVFADERGPFVEMNPWS